MLVTQQLLLDQRCLNNLFWVDSFLSAGPLRSARLLWCQMCFCCFIWVSTLQRALPYTSVKLMGRSQRLPCSPLSRCPICTAAPTASTRPFADGRVGTKICQRNSQSKARKESFMGRMRSVPYWTGERGRDPSVTAWSPANPGNGPGPANGPPNSSSYPQKTVWHKALEFPKI